MCSMIYSRIYLHREIYDQFSRGSDGDGEYCECLGCSWHLSLYVVQRRAGVLCVAPGWDDLRKAVHLPRLVTENVNVLIWSGLILSVILLSAIVSRLPHFQPNPTAGLPHQLDGPAWPVQLSRQDPSTMNDTEKGEGTGYHELGEMSPGAGCTHWRISVSMVCSFPFWSGHQRFEASPVFCWYG